MIRSLPPRLLDLILELKNDGMNLVLVTHEMGFAREAADKIMFLGDGRIIDYGSAESIISNSSDERSQKISEQGFKT